MSEPRPDFESEAARAAERELLDQVPEHLRCGEPSPNIFPSTLVQRYGGHGRLHVHSDDVVRQGLVESGATWFS